MSVWERLRNCLDMADHYKPIEIEYRGFVSKEDAYELEEGGYSVRQSDTGYRIKNIKN